MPDPAPEPIPAIGYIRVSMAREEMISPELQTAAITDWARRNNRRVVEWVSDLDKSGRNFKRRVQDAITAVETRRAVEIIVWKFSRFGRNRLGWAVNLDRVEQAGGQLQSATEEVDARTAAGRFSRGMLAEVAAFESDRASEQWKEALNYRLKRGLPATGGRRFGYVRRGRVPRADDPRLHTTDPSDPDGERYEPCPNTGPALVAMYEHYLAGDGSHSIVQWLNSRGYQTTKDAPWSQRAVLSTLDSGFAAGFLRVHDADCRCKQRGRCERVHWLPGAHKPLIDERTWEDYQRARAGRRPLGPRAKSASYALSGLMVCAGCTYKMTIVNGPGGRGYAYKCQIWKQRECPGSWVRRVVAEQAVLDELRRYVEDLDQRATTTAARQAGLAAARADREHLSRELVKVDAALKKLARQRLTDDAMPDAIYDELRDELVASRAEFEAAIRDVSEVEREQGIDLVPVIVGLLAEWDTLSASRRREILARLVRQVTVHRTAAREPPRIVVTPVWAG